MHGLSWLTSSCFSVHIVRRGNGDRDREGEFHSLAWIEMSIGSDK